jgi:hypothetical protein
VPLLQLFYVSRAALSRDADAVQGILRSSRRNNATDDITGCLLFSGCFYGQVLEGRPELVRQRLDRIRADGRNSDVRVLLERRMSVRDYADWSMGYLHDLGLEDALERLLLAPTNDDAMIASIMERMRPDLVTGSVR